MLDGGFTPFISKGFQMWDHFFLLLFPKDSESLRILNIQLREVGAKIHLNGTSKVDTRTNRQTNTHTDKSTYRKHRPRRPMLWKHSLVVSCVRQGSTYLHYAVDVAYKFEAWIFSSSDQDLMGEVPALQSGQWAVCSVQWTLESVQCAVCIVQFALCSVHCSVCSVQCAVCSGHWKVCGVQCAVCIVHWTLYHGLSIFREVTFVNVTSVAENTK